MIRINILICSLLFSLQAMSYVDLNLSYTFSMRQVNGVETVTNNDPGSVQSTTSGYTLNWAWYIWEYTAIEFNYAENKQRLLDDRKIIAEDADGDAFTIKETDNTVITQISGVGIRQSFAGRGSRVIPSLAIGYAQFVTSGTQKYLLEIEGNDIPVQNDQDREVFSSSYITLAVKFAFTKFLGLTLSGKAVMPDFDTSQAANNVTYSAGLAWMF